MTSRELLRFKVAVRPFVDQVWTRGTLGRLLQPISGKQGRGTVFVIGKGTSDELHVRIRATEQTHLWIFYLTLMVRGFPVETGWKLHQDPRLPVGTAYVVDPLEHRDMRELVVEEAVRRFVNGWPYTRDMRQRLLKLP